MSYRRINQNVIWGLNELICIHSGKTIAWIKRALAIKPGFFFWFFFCSGSVSLRSLNILQPSYQGFIIYDSFILIVQHKTVPHTAVLFSSALFIGALFSEVSATRMPPKDSTWKWVTIYTLFGVWSYVN